MRKPQAHSAFTLVEVLLTILILGIVSAGVIHFQYYSMRCAKLAQTKIAATRLSALILENWKAQGGSNQYDPVEVDNLIIPLGDNRYRFTVDQVPFYMDIAVTDIATNGQTEVTLRQLELAIQWRADGASGRPGRFDPGFTLQTYVRRDQSGG